MLESQDPPASPIVQKPGRYVFVDALRGVAAVIVVLHHLLHVTVLDVTLHHILPVWFLAVCEIGNHGVQIFFVISGFVIAHSIRSLVPDLRGAGNFILRRQIRLDPPYWSILAATFIYTTVENHAVAVVQRPVPGLGGLLLNLIYLQNVTGATRVVDVAWTLCLEIQFYLLFMGATSIGWLTSRRNPSSVAIALVLLSGTLCLAFARQQLVFVAWFPAFWPYFVLGAACYWATHQLLPRWVFALYFAAFSVAGFWIGSTYMLFGLVTALSIFVVAQMGRLRTLGSNRILQYLGRISYSLYLVHVLVLSIIMRGGYKLTHENRGAAVFWFVLAGGASVVVADVFHRMVEVPSMRLASALKPGRPPEPPTVNSEAVVLLAGESEAV